MYPPVGDGPSSYGFRAQTATFRREQGHGRKMSYNQLLSGLFAVARFFSRVTRLLPLPRARLSLYILTNLLCAALLPVFAANASAQHLVSATHEKSALVAAAPKVGARPDIVRFRARVDAALA